MNALAIDTSTEILSVAASKGEGPHQRVLLSRHASLRHTSRVMEYVRFALAELAMDVSDLEMVACMRGPGSFTGLRIGMATAKGLAQAVAARRHLARPPLISVNTLEAMAYKYRERGQTVLPVIDGRKGRFYCAAFRGSDELVPQGDYTVEELISRLKRYASDSFYVTGTHADLFVERVSETEGPAAAAGYVVDHSYMGAADSLRTIAIQAAARGSFDPIDVAPVYLRKSDAEIGGASSRSG